ncbi:MAG: aminotransferase class V-fold PLP-dependent enzyme [Alphaproteobacteria bacterium]|jgi:alanine-glyoxylate transaminase / serine-glyoxylate transaminase / serine-pyruvate transaminase|nr:aminotransferase class V-fold PLP-dependent enzyme [Alphaproteobacteria bacterium]
MTYQSGRHFLQIPGPTNVPERILLAMASPTIDHRGPAFAELGLSVLSGIKDVFKTEHPVVIFPASGTGAWEAALVNTLSPGDRVLMFETGQFACLWKKLAESLEISVDFVPGDWRRGIDAAEVEDRLKADTGHTIKVVCAVHNETSTGVRSNIADVRSAMNSASHPALLMVDTISSLACMDYRHDEWGVDVTVSGSQKGLMLPPGLSFTAVSPKSLAASETSGFLKSYWRWADMLAANEKGFFPYTPATNLFYGLQEALAMLAEESLEAVFARHARHAEATRRAVRAWGLEVLCANEHEYSQSLTAVLMPEGRDADEFRRVVLDNFDMSLGSGLGRVAGKIFRIGHLGDFNDLTLGGTLVGVEMGLRLFGLDNVGGGVDAAMDYLTEVRGG